MDEKRLNFIEEWYSDYHLPSAEGHIKELITEVRKLNEKIKWLDLANQEFRNHPNA